MNQGNGMEKRFKFMQEISEELELRNGMEKRFKFMQEISEELDLRNGMGNGISGGNFCAGNPWGQWGSVRQMGNQSEGV